MGGPARLGFVAREAVKLLIQMWRTRKQRNQGRAKVDMSIYLDYTHRIPPSALKAANCIGVCRYLSPDSASWKRIGKAEYGELLAAGIDVVLNWEYDAKDWMTTQGFNHATEAVRQARNLGHPAGDIIIGSCDFDMNHDQWVYRGRSYATAFARVINAAGYVPGVYGPSDVLQWCSDEDIMHFGWQAGMSTAWSGGRNRIPSPFANLRQRGHMVVMGFDTDWNEILKPLKGDTMSGLMRIAAVKQPDGKTSWFFGDGITYRTIITWPEHENLMASGAKEKAYNHDQDWHEWVGRIEEKPMVTIPPVTAEITQEMLNAAVASIIPALAAELAEHIRIE